MFKSKKIISVSLAALALTFAPLSISEAKTYGCDALNELETYSNKKSFEKIVNGKGEWFFRTKTDFKEKFELNSAGKKRFQRLKALLDKNDIELILALIPTRGIIHVDQAISDDFDFERAKAQYLKAAQQIEDQGIPVVTAFDGEPLTDKDYFYQRDHHWTPFGAEHMAKAVAAEVKAMPSYKKIKKASFKTSVEGEYDQEGTYAKFIADKCKQDVPPQKIPSYKTFSEGEADDLFGDVSEPEIVLIGTSNSTHFASHANFDGFLRQHIGADVANKSISGGGGDSAMYKVFLDEKVRVNMPKVIVWEVPVYQDLDSGPFFRQVLPTINGSCEGKAIAENTYTSSNDMISLFDEEFKKGFQGQNKYLELNFSDWKERKFKFNAHYDGSEKDNINVRRVKRYEPDGIFFIEFDQEKVDPITKATLSLPSKYEGEFTARICSY